MFRRSLLTVIALAGLSVPTLADPQFQGSALGALQGRVNANAAAAAQAQSTANAALTPSGDGSALTVKAGSMSQSIAAWVAANAAAAAAAQAMANGALPHVASNAALKAYAGLLTVVRRDGYYAAGDGGAAVYSLSSTACAKADNGAQVTAASGGCWVMDTSAVAPNIAQWGASTSTADNSAAIQAAFDACVGRMVIPAGTFNHASTLTESCTGNIVEGRGRLVSTLNMTTAGANGINVTGTYDTFRSFGAATPKTSPSDVWLITGGSFTADDFVIRGGYNDLHFNGSSGHKLTNFDLLDYANAGLYAESMSDLFMSHFIFNAGQQTGSLGGIRLVNRVEAFNATDGDILGGNYSFTMDASTYAVSQRPAYNSFVGVYFDSSLYGAIINNTVLTTFTNCWWSNGRTGSGYPGVTVQNSDAIRFLGSNFVNNGSHGALVAASAKHTVFQGDAFSNNSASSSGSADGLHFAAGATDFVVGGSIATNSPSLGSSQRYGIMVETGASDRYSIGPNSVSGNATGGVSDGGSGTNKLVQGNF